MGMPVVTVASGGMPVIDVSATTGKGVPVSEAVNGFGRAVTKVAAYGMPVVYVTTPLLAEAASQSEPESNGQADRSRAGKMARR